MVIKYFEHNRLIRAYCHQTFPEFYCRIRIYTRHPHASTDVRVLMNIRTSNGTLPTLRSIMGTKTHRLPLPNITIGHVLPKSDYTNSRRVPLDFMYAIIHGKRCSINYRAALALLVKLKSNTRLGRQTLLLIQNEYYPIYRTLLMMMTHVRRHRIPPALCHKTHYPLSQGRRCIGY